MVQYYPPLQAALAKLGMLQTACSEWPTLAFV